MRSNRLNDVTPSELPPADNMSAPGKLKKLKSTAKARTKHLLSIGSTDGDNVNVNAKKAAGEAAQQELESPAFNSAKFLKKSDPTSVGIRDRTTAAFRVT